MLIQPCLQHPSANTTHCCAMRKLGLLVRWTVRFQMTAGLVFSKRKTQIRQRLDETKASKRTCVSTSREPKRTLTEKFHFPCSSPACMLDRSLNLEAQRPQLWTTRWCSGHGTLTTKHVCMDPLCSANEGHWQCVAGSPTTCWKSLTHGSCGGCVVPQNIVAATPEVRMVFVDTLCANADLSGRSAKPPRHRRGLSS